MMKFGFLLVASVMIAAPMSSGQSVWKEQFDALNLGTWAGQGGWTEWSGSSGVEGDIVDSFFLTGTQSGQVLGDDGTNPNGDDVVYDFSQLAGGRPGGSPTNNGVWAMTTNMYLESGATGEGWFILLNTYPAADGDDWSASVSINNNTGKVQDRSFAGGRGSQRDIRYDQWVPLTVIVDLDDLRFDVFYAGEVIRSGATWAPDPLRNVVAAVDLYGNEPASNPISGLYFDDLCLEKVMGAESSALSMTPNPIVGGSNLRIDADAPELAGAPGLLFATFVSGVPVFRPTLSFNFDSNGHFGLTAPVPNGVPPLDIAFKTFALGSQGLTGSNEMRLYFR